MKQYQWDEIVVMVLEKYIVVRNRETKEEKKYSKDFYKKASLLGDRLVLCDENNDPHRIFKFKRIFWIIDL